MKPIWKVTKLSPVLIMILTRMSKTAKQKQKTNLPRDYQMSLKMTLNSYTFIPKNPTSYMKSI